MRKTFYNLREREVEKEPLLTRQFSTQKKRRDRLATNPIANDTRKKERRISCLCEPRAERPVTKKANDDASEIKIFFEKISSRSSRLVPFVRLDPIDDERERRIHTSSSARR